MTGENGRFALESDMRGAGPLTLREPDEAFRLKATVNVMFFDPRREKSTRYTMLSML